jgi:hypothetical protein
MAPDSQLVGGMGIYGKLFALPVLTAMLLSSTGPERDWWRSDAGKVTEYKDRDNVTCTLILTGHDGDVAFMWNNRLPLRVIVEQPKWNLPDNRMWQVSFRIGDAWLGGGDGSPDIPALTAPHGVMFVLDQPIATMLSTAQSLTVRTPDRVFEMNVPPNKMRPLVDALLKCTEQIKRVQVPG